MSWKEYIKAKGFDKLQDEPIKNMCVKCVNDQIQRYGEVTIQCTGLQTFEASITEQHGETVYKELLNVFDEAERLNIMQAYNPYDWMRANVKDSKSFTPRWYQERTVQCSAKRKVLRMGRRCGKTYSMVVGAIHRLMTRTGYKILVVAPLITMIDEIVESITAICQKLDVNPIVSSTSQPIVEMRFSNGSVLKGVTASNDAKAVRGKGGDLIWLEEADFIDPKAVNSILGLLADSKDTELWVSSTPIGERNLYNFSKQKNFKEFHFPTFLIPGYDQELDDTFKGNMSPTGYVQEVMAEFGADDSGVFQLSFIDEAVSQEHEKYSDTKNLVLQHRSNYLITIGVDWNHDKVGTRVVVVALDKELGCYFVVEMQKVSLLGWTQDLAVDLIVELNRKYNADHIYTDEGFGVAQGTILRKKGYEQYGLVPLDHPDLKLVDVQSVTFGGTLKVTDPYTNQTYNKRVKQYLVENAATLLEAGQLVLQEVKDADLILQMKNYIIKNIAATGAKAFSYRDKQIGDHDLDAYMLALYGFNVEYSGLIKYRPDEYVAGFAKDVTYETGSDSSYIEEVGSSGLYLKQTSQKKKPFKKRRMW